MVGPPVKTNKGGNSWWPSPPLICLAKREISEDKKSYPVRVTFLEALFLGATWVNIKKVTTQPPRVTPLIYIVKRGYNSGASRLAPLPPGGTLY
jgi:hypothetical protein